MPEIVGRARRGSIAADAPAPDVAPAQEELGDLKLYRIPEPVTVAARSQKQVAFLEQAEVQVAHRLPAAARSRRQPAICGPARRLLVTRNRTDEGLGLPLPAGRVQLFAAARRPADPDRRGRSIDDHAVGEDVEIEVGEAPGVTTAVERPQPDGAGTTIVLTVTNDQSGAGPLRGRVRRRHERDRSGRAAPARRAATAGRSGR